MLIIALNTKHRTNSFLYYTKSRTSVFFFQGFLRWFGLKKKKMPLNKKLALACSKTKSNTKHRTNSFIYYTKARTNSVIYDFSKYTPFEKNWRKWSKMMIKIYISTHSEGRLNMPSNDHTRAAPHGGMAASSGILVDDPNYINMECKKAIEAVKLFAEEHGFNYRIYDVRNDWPAMRARIEGIKVLPTTVFGKKKIEGIPSFDEMAACL